MTDDELRNHILTTRESLHIHFPPMADEHRTGNLNAWRLMGSFARTHGLRMQLASLPLDGGSPPSRGEIRAEFERLLDEAEGRLT